MCMCAEVKAGAVEAAGSCKHAGELESCCGLLGSFAHQKKQLQAQVPPLFVSVQVALSHARPYRIGP